MPAKAFLCLTFGWNHVYPLVDSLVPGSPGTSGWPTSLFFPWGYKPLQLLQSALQLLHWGTHAQSNGWLLASASICVRLWQRPSRDHHNRLLSVHTSFIAELLVIFFHFNFVTFCFLTYSVYTSTICWNVTSVTILTLNFHSKNLFKDSQKVDCTAQWTF